MKISIEYKYNLFILKVLKKYKHFYYKYNIDTIYFKISYVSLWQVE